MLLLSHVLGTVCLSPRREPRATYVVIFDIFVFDSGQSISPPVPSLPLHLGVVTTRPMSESSSLTYRRQATTTVTSASSATSRYPIRPQWRSQRLNLPGQAGGKKCSGHSHPASRAFLHEAGRRETARGRSCKSQRRLNSDMSTPALSSSRFLLSARLGPGRVL